MKKLLLLCALLIFACSYGQEDLTSPEISDLETLNSNLFKNLFQGDFSNAKNILDKLIELDNEDAVWYNFRGICNHTLNEFQDAMEDYNYALKLRPDYTFAYTNKGLLSYKLKDYETALISFNMAIENAPEDYQGYLYRAITNMKINDMKSACIDLQKASNCDFYEGAAWYDLTKIYPTKHIDNLRKQCN